MANPIDPMIALQTITNLAKTSPNAVVYAVDVDGPGVFNGHGATISDVLTMLARATTCVRVAEYTMYGYHHTVAQESAAGMAPPQWALPGTLATGQTVMVLVSIEDWPSANTLNVQEGLADASGVVGLM